MLSRQWMYNRNLPGRQGLTNEIITGVDEFIQFAINQDGSYKNGDNIRCPCFKCKNRRFLHPNDVTFHLYRRGFKECYWNWTCHGEELFPISEEPKEVDDQTSDHMAQEDEQMTWDQRMIYDCLRSHVPPMDESHCYDEAGPSVQPPLDEPVSGLQSDEISQLSNRFFDVLKAAERIMRAANCSPISYPLLPSTYQHHMWDAWDMAAEICLAKLPQLIEDPNAEFQPRPFFTEQLTAFEVWLDHGSEHKKLPEQLPIVLQVLLCQSHRFRALVLLGRFLDMGPWAVDLALSVGIFPYVLKLLQTTAMELRQILVFIWTKILALNKSCQVDLVKDGGHAYFIRFLDSMDAYPEQRAMAALVLAVIVDGHRRGQEACFQANLVHVCLRHLQLANPHDAQTEPLLLQWLCLCLGKLWEDFSEAQLLGLQWLCLY